MGRQRRDSPRSLAGVGLSVRGRRLDSDAKVEAARVLIAKRRVHGRRSRSRARSEYANHVVVWLAFLAVIFMLMAVLTLFGVAPV